MTRIGSPYYIGKGQKNRAYAKKRHTPPPSDSNNIVFVSTEMSEPDAFQLEMLLIHLHGRIDKGTGCLRNFTDGGEGQSGRNSWNKGKTGIYSEATKALWSTQRKGVVLTQAHKDKVVAALRSAVHTPASVAKRVATRRAGKGYTLSDAQRVAFDRTGKPTREAQKEAARKFNEQRWADPKNREEMSKRMSGSGNYFFGKHLVPWNKKAV
jgi:hypothetical protein